jgi:hypothetical protein
MSGVQSAALKCSTAPFSGDANETPLGINAGAGTPDATKEQSAFKGLRRISRPLMCAHDDTPRAPPVARRAAERWWEAAALRDHALGALALDGSGHNHDDFYLH